MNPLPSVGLEAWVALVRTTGMPRYTFAYSDLPPDVEPIVTDLASPEAARSEAAMAASELLRDGAARFWHSPDWTIDVTDEAGGLVCRVQVSGTTGSG